MLHNLNENEKMLARSGKAIGAIRSYRKREYGATLQFAFRIVEAYREGFKDAQRFILRGE